MQRINTKKFKSPKHKSLLVPPASILKKKLCILTREREYSKLTKNKKKTFLFSISRFVCIMKIQWKVLLGRHPSFRGFKKIHKPKRNIVVFFKD
jgi:hypothetical protein